MTAFKYYLVESLFVFIVVINLKFNFPYLFRGTMCFLLLLFRVEVFEITSHQEAHEMTTFNVFVGFLFAFIIITNGCVLLKFPVSRRTNNGRTKCLFRVKAFWKLRRVAKSSVNPLVAYFFFFENMII